MKKFACLALVIMAVASAALAHEGPVYDFNVRVTPSRANRFLLHILVMVPDGMFTLGTDMAADETQTITSEKAERTMSIVLRLNAGGDGTADLQVREKNGSVQTLSRSFTPMMPPVDDGKYKRMGTGIQAPVVIQRVEPIYTTEARAARISGIVIVEARISETGAVDDVRVMKPLPFGLDEAAAEAVRQWKFRPATQDGKPIPVVFNLTVNFRLDKLE